MARKRQSIREGSASLLSASMIWLGTVLAAWGDIRIATMQIGSETYQNVTITSKTADSIFITHAKGFANVKLADVSPELLAKLGYDPGRVLLRSKKSIVLKDMPLDPRLLAMKESVMNRFEGSSESFETNLMLTALCVLLAGYLFICYCFQLICQKAGGKPGLAVWIPVLQLMPLLQAAGMSGVWFILILLPVATPLLAVPLLTLVGPANFWVLFLPLIPVNLAYMLWCLKICRLRGLPDWVAFFLIFPGTNFFTFLYLAFSSAGVKARGERGPGHGKVTAQDTAFFFQT